MTDNKPSKRDNNKYVPVEVVVVLLVLACFAFLAIAYYSGKVSAVETFRRCELANITNVKCAKANNWGWGLYGKDN